MDVTDLQIVPFGNAYFNGTSCGGGPATSWDRTAIHCWIALCSVDNPPAECFQGSASCQHGPTECEYNKWEACAVTLNTQLDGANYVLCMEESAESQKAPADAAQACAETASVDFTTIQQCFDGPDGVKAEAGMAAATVALGTSRPGTPWVVVDGTATQDPSQLLSLVCAAYQGPKPAGCSAFKAPPAMCAI